MLKYKIEASIALIKKNEALALQYNDFGYHIAFSGGKDSQVIYELCKMAGVKFKAFFYKTSVDPPELLKFIKDNYPDVICIKPPLTMYQLILKKQMLPRQNARFCCEVLKERNGLNSVIISGIRKQESAKRRKRKEFEASCKLGCDKNMLNIILDWTLNDVFTFLDNRHVGLCILYLIKHRIGCIGCPMNHKEQRKDFVRYPNHRKAYINTIGKLMQKGKYRAFDNPEDVFNWWISGVSQKEYMANKSQMKLNL
jgi:phosphoadenosine phosphosulfate reductase